MRLTLCSLLLLLEAAHGFAPASPLARATFITHSSSKLCASADDDGDSTPAEGGSDLAAELFKMAKERNIALEDDDMDDDEEDEWDDEEELDDEEAKDLTLTDKQIDEEVNERLLETAGGFVELLKPPSDEDDEEEKVEIEEKKPKEYKVPAKIPDAELTAGEVVELVLSALANNDVGGKNKGIDILFGYSSENSQIKQMDDLTPDEYVGYLQEGDYKVVFENQGVRIDKGEYSGDGAKAFYTARIQTGPKDFIPVNFILSTGGQNDDDVWLIDSMLIRPPGMRRNRRR
eukprot:CAMPEP_0119008532 /NCGR_PEP_ID=MMETSP1176-20130426/3763_1 /TAXON_ID=265551 /ORGANISM="Synedropsis recta cf, Strain CCMP1620" /LENGTH=288 /DNA_ID=CAMNT_0006960883 /DNA_START=46 /DNA_END=912 /DNA_ORIENTATION=+